MATVIPPPSKKQRRLAQQPRETSIIPENLPNVLIKFQASDTAESIGGNIRVPSGITTKQLEELLNQLNNALEDPIPYTFSLLLNNNNQPDSLVDINDNLYSSVLKPGLKTTEDFLTLVYTPQALFKVKPVTRSSSAISGHKATILSCQFAPYTSSRFVTGSGDSTARIWDSDTHTPVNTLSGHSNWVLCVAYSPDGSMIATGSMDNTIRLWDSLKGTPLGNNPNKNVLRGHLKWISSLSWEPLHLLKDREQQSRLCTGSKDTTIKVWDVIDRNLILTLSSHTSAISCVKWSGSNRIFSASHDKTIKIWNPENGTCVANLKAHAHWVNHLSLSTDYILRCGPFDYKSKNSSVNYYKSNRSELIENAKLNFNKVALKNSQIDERIVTASDDFTMYLWNPYKSNKPICRMVGHQKLVNHVAFSPDGRYIASASFDNSIKLWDGLNGTFIATLRGHVAPVYQIAWSSDCRLLVSCSKDTTLKVWDIKTRKLKADLPGHSDEVFSVDWSVDGKKVISGGKDKTVRIWTH
ncbi:Rsa4p [Ascoidea rubescens DSM 1968]|uniref:WD40 repeat-like protein n=1 Tax=Ascoidea rubescens DSM 1968 TaxID=1344418 RepID=A0A1D2VIQ9_9ASCO|nr:WD40 repeat-like protein [Ascoidea rubescens DSM 1968]ODV61393.1 WD40 repeat-like protein [Ascoidea rubescens DSM 1968]